MDADDFLQKVKTLILNRYPDAKIILFGSRARGVYKDDSDWDLLILLNILVTDSIKEKIRDELLQLEIEFGQTISTIIYSRQTWDNLQVTPLHKNIALEGVIL